MRELSLVAALLGALALAACGSSGSGNPEPDVPEEDPGTDGSGDAQLEAIDVVFADEAATHPDDGEVPAELPPDAADVLDEADAGPCTKDQDCPTAGLAACQLGKCRPDGTCGWTWDKTCCIDNATQPFLASGFEDGLPAGWLVAVGDKNGPVTWSVVDSRHAKGAKSLYFGDPTCHTYYNGALDGDCKPVDPSGKDAGRVFGAVTTPKFELPPTKGLQMAWFALYSLVEPAFPGLPPEAQSDILKVFVVTDPGEESEDTEVVFSSLDLPTPKQTDGRFRLVTVDLSDWNGKEIALKLSFESSDGSNNHFEGVYVDDLAVFSVCKPAKCDPGTPCSPDGLECTDDGCTGFANTPAQMGVCWHWEDPACVEPPCTPANVAEKCPIKKDNPACWQASCPAGECVFTLLPDCCESGSKLAIDFDDGALGGFTTWAYRGNPKVKWQISSHRAASGKYALYYGDVVSNTYFSGDVQNFGEATSPEITLSGGDYFFLAFNLYLSTEFDEIVPEDYYNPVGTDLGEVLVVQNFGKPTESTKRVWSSDNVRGSTVGQGQDGFIPVGIDLSGFKGKKIWVRFVFNTGDALKNSFEGVYIDDVSVSYDCRAHDCKGDYDCGFDGVCSIGACTDEVCTPDAGVEPDPSCCSNAQDCDDGDPCTIEGCIQNTCYYDFIESPDCCQEGTFAEFLFDSAAEFDQFAVVDTGTPGEGGPAVTWRYSDARFHGDAPGAAYIGDAATKTYDNLGTVVSSLASPEFEVPTYGILQLGFRLYMDIEPSDANNSLKVEIVPMIDTNPTKTVFQKSEGMAFDTWFEVSGIDMNDYKGQWVKLRFTFEATHSDLVPDPGAGVWIDTIRARKVCPGEG
ncbi:MAG: hypothetical protein FJ087_18255 [Deltaproteobacteria bacterium]|nr:hypothetical protein [Deltaproteobacteria bacterium]